MTSLGLICQTVASSSFQAAYVPGLELSIQMAARASKRKKSSRARAWDRSALMQKMLRRSWTQLVDTAACSCEERRMPMVRQPTSPVPGRSTWITSAPISAANSAAKGWAISVPEDTMRTPWSGPKGCGTKLASLINHLPGDRGATYSVQFVTVAEPGGTCEPAPAGYDLRPGAGPPSAGLHVLLWMPS